MPCHDARTFNENSCCCKHCVHVRPNNPECCRCIPRRVCFIWYGPDEYAAPSRWVFVYNEERQEYDNITQGPFPGPAANTYTVWLEIIKTEADECAWALLGSDVGTPEDPDQSHIELMDNPEVKCLTQEGQYFQVDDWELNGVPGTVIIKQYDFQMVPSVQNGNSIEPLCNNCLCFPRCLCMTYIWQEGFTHETWGWRVTTQTSRVVWLCWDPFVGDHGGWKWRFPQEEDNESCAYAVELILELAKDGNGDCQFILSDDRGDFDDTFPSVTNFACNEDFTAIWYKTLDATTRLQVMVSSEGCTDTCYHNCCQFYPETLTGVISNSEGHIKTLEFELQRQDCATPTYTANGVVVEWDCTDENAGGEGTGKFDIEIRCRGCKWSYWDLICKCDCDETLPFGDQGCWFLEKFETYDFECDPPVRPCAGEPGNLYDEYARCTPGSPSSCVPLIQHWDIGVQGSQDCMDNFDLVVTE